MTRTGKLLIVEPDVTFAGVGAEVAADVSERSLPMLKRRVKRLGAPRTLIPVSQDLHMKMIPSRGEIAASIGELLS